MCTALKYKHCVGRNFDYEMSYQEQIIKIKRDEYDSGFAILGICSGIAEEYPLLYDGINECGLFCGALAFTGNAHYNEPEEFMINIPAYQFVFEILGQFRDVATVEEWLIDVNITNENYSDTIQNTDMHWFICDENDAIIVEQTIDGLKVYHNDVMTNNPPYPLQKDICEFGLSMIGDSVSNYGNDPVWYSRGRKTDGLAGGYSSDERFERLTYLLGCLNNCEDIFSPINETMHLLGSVEQIYGVTDVQDKFEYTIYSVVYNLIEKNMVVKLYNRLEPKYFQLYNENNRSDL